MQKFIAKYGLAAHLAILAVAPLFLFPFCGERVVAAVLLWLSLLTGLWMLLGPSVHGGERLHDARYRVASALLSDPLSWVLLGGIIFSGFRALNTGIAFRYNAETAVWYVSSATVPIFPGVVGSSGDLDFAVAVAFFVLVQSCRHSVGRLARMAFLLIASALAGLAAIVSLWALREGCPVVGSLWPSSVSGSCSFAGFPFGLYMMGALISLVAIFENKWNMAVLLVLLGVSGSGAGMFAFAPDYQILAFSVAGLVVLLYVSFYLYWTMRSSSELKFLVIAGVSLALGGLTVVFFSPADVLDGHIASFANLRFFSEQYWTIRKLLSDVAFGTWTSNLWIGTGLGSFSFDLRFAAKPEDWALLPRHVTALANGWWFVLVERGIVGSVFLILPFGFLLVSYVRRLIVSLKNARAPHPTALFLPLTLVLLIGGAFFDCSAFRADAMLVMGALAALSATAFSERKRGENG